MYMPTNTVLIHEKFGGENPDIYNMQCILTSEAWNTAQERNNSHILLIVHYKYKPIWSMYVYILTSTFLNDYIITN